MTRSSCDLFCLVLAAAQLLQSLISLGCQHGFLPQSAARPTSKALTGIKHACQADVDEALRLMRMSKVSLLESGHQKEQKDPVSLIYEAIRDDAQRSGKQSYTWGDLNLLIGNQFMVSMHDVFHW